MTKLVRICDICHLTRTQRYDNLIMAKYSPLAIEE